jgi:ribosomal protein L10
MEQYPRPQLHTGQCPIFYASEKERTVKRQVTQYRRDLLHCVGWLSSGVKASLGAVVVAAAVAACAEWQAKSLLEAQARRLARFTASEAEAAARQMKAHAEPGGEAPGSPVF